MAAAAKTVLVTRSAINADAMAWPAKPPQDSGVYAVDLRPLLKAEKIALGSFVAMPIEGLCVSTQSQQGGLLLLAISGGSAQTYRLQFVFSDTEGHIDVFQVALPVPQGVGCGVSSSAAGRGMRGAIGPAGPLGAPGRPGPAGPAGPPGIIDGTTVKALSGGVAAGDELLLWRPGSGFFYVPAALLLPRTVVFDTDVATFGGTGLTFGTAPALGPVTFNGQTVTAGGAGTTFGTAALPTLGFGSQDVVFAGQKTSFGTAPGAPAATFAGQGLTYNGRDVGYGTSSTAADYAGQPTTYAGQPVGYVQPAGTVAAATPREFTFVQDTPAMTWTINHRLGIHPAVRPVNPDGDLVDAEVHYSDANSVVLSFGNPFAGTAYLS